MGLTYRCLLPLSICLSVCPSICCRVRDAKDTMTYRSHKVFLTNEELVTKAKNHEAISKRLHSDRGEVVSYRRSIHSPEPALRARALHLP